MFKVITILSILFFNISWAQACTLDINEAAVSSELEAVARASYIGQNRTVQSSNVESLSVDYFTMPNLNPDLPSCPGVIATATVSVTYTFNQLQCTERIGVISKENTYEIVRDFSVPANRACE
jgi:hypothetical protein